MRATHVLPITFFVAPLLFSLTACPPPEPAGGPPAPTSAVVDTPPATATATATAAVTAEPTATATVAATAEPPPAAPGPFDLVNSVGDPRLEPAAVHIKAGDYTKARDALTKVMPEIDTSVRTDVRMAAHALLGRACKELKDDKCAAEQYKAVRGLWKDPDAAQKALDAMGGDDRAKLDRLRRALTAAGEALFAAAEEKRADVDKERFPAYNGKGDRQSVMDHVKKKVTPWVKKRRAAIEEADKAYQLILQLQPVPPPQWVVAAAARVGQMWGKFVAEFRASPIPNEWKGTGVLPGTTLTKEEIRQSYYEVIDEASEPQKNVARSAFKTCSDLAKKFNVQSEYQRSCDVWLEKNTPAAPAAATP